MRISAAFFLLGGAALCGCAPIDGQAIGDLRIDEPWARATPSEVKVSAGYLIVRNLGERDDRLISIASAAARIEMHEVRNEDGLMKMRHMEKGIAIPAGAAVALQPGGYHLMLLDLQQPLSADEVVMATLQFEHAGAAEVAFQVRAVGGSASGSTTHVH
jgi:periplasmic copper chaperone A